MPRTPDRERTAPVRRARRPAWPWPRPSASGCLPGLLIALALHVARASASTIDVSPVEDALHAAKPEVLPEVHRVPARTATGIYVGYPSYLGAQVLAPVDGTLAFRFGLTGLPAVGILWTPGVELRFGQVSGTHSTDGPYSYANGYLSRSFSHSQEDDQHNGIEGGLGYRWLLDDRRGVRWIAALEVGGYWEGDSGMPLHPSMRLFWMLAD